MSFLVCLVKPISDRPDNFIWLVAVAFDIHSRKVRKCLSIGKWIFLKNQATFLAHSGGTVSASPIVDAKFEGHIQAVEFIRVIGFQSG